MPDDAQDVPSVQISPRYYRWFVDCDRPWRESHTGYDHLEWQVPVGSMALVLVDVWDRHYLPEPQERIDRITRDMIRPLVEACREAGVHVIHAPSAETAERYRDHWPAGTASQAAERPDWPPASFRARTGPYRRFAGRDEPGRQEWEALKSSRRIHPAVAPLAGDSVVPDADALHRLCRERKLLFLFYAGFHTNSCVLLRDYGMWAMSQRGYATVLLRDATTGLEASFTRDTMEQTRQTTLLLEMFGSCSIPSGELLTALDALRTSSDGESCRSSVAPSTPLIPASRIESQST